PSCRAPLYGRRRARRVGDQVLRPRRGGVARIRGAHQHRRRPCARRPEPGRGGHLRRSGDARQDRSVRADRRGLPAPRTHGARACAGRADGARALPCPRPRSRNERRRGARLPRCPRVFRRSHRRQPVPRDRVRRSDLRRCRAVERSPQSLDQLLRRTRRDAGRPCPCARGGGGGRPPRDRGDRRDIGRADRASGRAHDAGRRDRHLSYRANRSDQGGADASLTRHAATLRGRMPPSSTLLRAALALTATGIVSAASIRHVQEESGADVMFAVAYAYYLSLILIATPRHPPRWAPVLGFAFAAITYVAAILTLNGNALAVGLYLLVALLGYLATPATFRPLTVAAFALWTPAIRFFGPDPLAGQFPPLLAFASVLSLINLVATLLDRSAHDPDERLRRIGLGLLAVATVATVVERHLAVESLVVAPDDVMALVVVGVLPLLAVVRLRPSTRDAIATGLALATFVLAAMALILGKGYHVDAVTVPHVAAQQLLAGHDPYSTFDLPAALAQFGMNPDLV